MIVRRTTFVALLVLGSLAAVPLATPAHASGPKSHEWTGVNSGSWNDGENWSTHEVPAALDIVTIASGAHKTVTGVPNINLTAFTLGPDMELGDPTAETGSIVALNVTLNGGTIHVPVTADLLLTVAQTDTEKPIVLSGNDADLTSQVEALSFGGSRIETYFDADIINNGLWHVTPGLLSNRTTIAVNRCCTGAPSRFDNFGTVDKVGDASTMVIDNGVYVGRAGSKVRTRLELVGGQPRFGGRSQVIGSGAAIVMRNGAVMKSLLTADPTIDLRNGAKFVQTEGSKIASAATFVKSGTGTPTYEWTSGDITEPVVFDSGVDVRVKGNALRAFTPPKPADSLTIKTDVTFEGDAELRLSGRLVNTGSIQVAANKSPSITGSSCCTAPYRIVNSGTIAATRTGSSITVANAALWSVGPDSVLKGTVFLDGGINRLGNGASISGANSRVAQLHNGVLNGDGSLTIDDGSSLTVQGFSSIVGSPDFSIDGKGTFVWNSGYLSGQLTIGEKATMQLVNLGSEIDPFRQITTSGRDSLLVNEGNVVQRADLRLAGSTFDAVVRNNGTWMLKKGGVLRWGASLLRNSGKLVVDGETPGTVTRFNADKVFFWGDVDVKKGDLFVEPTTTFKQLGGDVTVSKDSALFVAVQYKLSGGRLQGNGVVETSMLVNDAEVKPSPGKARLRIIGDYRQTGSGVLAIELGTDESSNLFVSQDAYLAGTVKATTTGALPIIGTGSDIVLARDRIGTFDDLVGANASRLRLAYTRDTAMLIAR